MILVYNWERVQKIVINVTKLSSYHIFVNTFSHHTCIRKEIRNRIEAKHCFIPTINHTYPWIEEQKQGKPSHIIKRYIYNNIVFF